MFLKGYQYLLSPFLAKRCRFFPTCSQYAIEVFDHYSLIYSSYLVIRRLAKCHPFHPGGFDPVEKPFSNISSK